MSTPPCPHRNTRPHCPNDCGRVICKDCNRTTTKETTGMSEYRLQENDHGWGIFAPGGDYPLVTNHVGSFGQAMTLVCLANAGLAAEPKEPGYVGIAYEAERRYNEADLENDANLDRMEMVVDAVMAARDEWERQ